MLGCYCKSIIITIKPPLARIKMAVYNGKAMPFFYLVITGLSCVSLIIPTILQQLYDLLILSLKEIIPVVSSLFDDISIITLNLVLIVVIMHFNLLSLSTCRADSVRCIRPKNVKRKRGLKKLIRGRSINNNELLLKGDLISFHQRCTFQGSGSRFPLIYGEAVTLPRHDRWQDQARGRR